MKEIDSNNTEIIRRVLTSLLDRLDKSSAQASASGGPELMGSPAPQGAQGDASPLFLLMLGQLDSGSNGLKDAESEPRRLYDIEDRAATHPGLEKFSAPEGHQTDSAPRTCFMEPGRVCVNSGACEMRGY